jgi:hypothetical protein
MSAISIGTPGARGRAVLGMLAVLLTTMTAGEVRAQLTQLTDACMVSALNRTAPVGRLWLRGGQGGNAEPIALEERLCRAEILPRVAAGSFQ